jgi:hypothetical protein
MPDSLDCCPACAGFVPAALAACPHCAAPCPASRPRSLRRVLATMLGSAACAVTLMACYGVAPRHANYADPHCEDLDRDGACAPQDCDDGDPTVFPGAEDPDLDGVDQNCDGVDGWRDPAAIAVPPPDPAGAPGR